MADAPADGAPEPQNAPRPLKVGVTVDLVLAALVLLLSLLAQANSPTGKMAWAETLLVLAVTLGAAALGSWLYHAVSRMGGLLVVWSPIPLGIVAVLISNALGH